MKKLLLINLIALFMAGYSFAQDVDITEVYLANGGSSSLKIQSDSAEINTNKFILAAFYNNLTSDLTATDSVSFGYSVEGTKLGEIGRITGRPVARGNSFTFIVDDNYAIGATTKTNVEICVWSLYNPYNPQTTDNNGTELCRSSFTFYDPTVQPSSIQMEEEKELKMGAFYNKGNLFVTMSGTSEGQVYDLQVIDLTGQVVLKDQFRINRSQGVYESFDFGAQPHGVYLVNLKSEDYSKTVKFIKN